jgi:hypothetical protein
MKERYLVMDQVESFLTVEPSFPGKAGDPVWVFGEKDHPDAQEPYLSGITVEGNRVWVPSLAQQPKFIPTAVQIRKIDPKVKPFYGLVQRHFFLGDQPSILYVEAAYLGESKAGQLTWLLTYLSPQGGREVSVAMGDDRTRKGCVYARFPGYLRPGIYILYANLYRENGQLWLKDRRIWPVPWWCPGLLSGRAMDRLLPLFYNQI